MSEHLVVFRSQVLTSLLWDVVPMTVQFSKLLLCSPDVTCIVPPSGQLEISSLILVLKVLGMMIRANPCMHYEGEPWSPYITLQCLI